MERGPRLFVCCLSFGGHLGGAQWSLVGLAESVGLVGRLELMGRMAMGDLWLKDDVWLETNVWSHIRDHMLNFEPYVSFEP